MVSDSESSDESLGLDANSSIEGQLWLSALPWNRNPIPPHKRARAAEKGKKRADAAALIAKADEKEARRKGKRKDWHTCGPPEKKPVERSYTERMSCKRMKMEKKDAKTLQAEAKADVKLGKVFPLTNYFGRK